MARPTTDPDFVDVDLRKYPADYLDCRVEGHAWRRVGYYREGNDIRRLFICRRCKTERRDHWSSRGVRISGGRYAYADGYEFTGSGGVELPMLRLEEMRRVQVYASEHSLTTAMLNGGRRGNGR